jgi:hypothetical protein
MYSFIHRGLARLLQLGLAIGVMALAGCATTHTVTARVTSFQQWPADAVGQTYRFIPANAAQNNNLEYQTFQDTLRVGLGTVGLVEAGLNQPARFDVSFNYGVTQTQVMRQQYQPYFYGGPGFYGPYGYWGGGWGYMGPDWVEVPTIAYRNLLTVTINDAAHSGMEVYRATAYITTANDRLLQTMPYLSRAIFDGFPGNNGTEREVKYTEGR